MRSIARKHNLFFFSATQLEAAKLLLTILENIIKKSENEDNAVTLPLSKSDILQYILQYIGGYLIAKICKKFPNSFESASMGLCSLQSPDPDSLIFLLNRIPNALQVPREEFLRLLIHVYYIFGKECTKRLTSVDFNQVIGFALNSNQILRYIETLANQCDLSYFDTQEILQYSIILFVKLLAHSFSKKRYESLFKFSTKYSVNFCSTLSK